mmetsp:Transcript_1308/g.1685  ORF Transcript_1308/g.1685 Transcript_1308/m.1685 type:complete len:87 (+) Transcript_1308:185-445(+)
MFGKTYQLLALLSPSEYHYEYPSFMFGVQLAAKRKFTSQGKTKTTGGKANESDEYIITNTPEATTSFPGCIRRNLERILTSCLNFL